jgi:hypothetical protein
MNKSYNKILSGYQPCQVAVYDLPKQVYIWYGWGLQPHQYPEDEAGDGSRNFGFFAF